MFRVASFNVNGIRAADRRGFRTWLATAGCDVVGLQELRCRPEDLPDGVFDGYHVAADHGRLPGRNGVAILTRTPPTAVRSWGSVEGADRVPPTRELVRHRDEGRYLEVDLADLPVTVASLYLPKGGLPGHLQRPGRMREAPDGGARYERKQRFMAGFARYLDRARRHATARGRQFLLLGDLNIAHGPADVAAWRRNQQAEGFLPEEREWIGSLLGPRRLHDVVRRLDPDGAGPYSWWSWLGNTYERDAGWRIDYHLATPRLARAARRRWVDRAVDGVRLSDHGAVIVDYDHPATSS